MADGNICRLADIERNLILERPQCNSSWKSSAFPEEKLRARALNAEAFGFLTKPFGDDFLIKCFDRALKS